MEVKTYPVGLWGAWLEYDDGQELWATDIIKHTDALVFRQPNGNYALAFATEIGAMRLVRAFTKSYIRGRALQIGPDGYPQRDPRTEEADRGDRSRWQTGVEDHRATCSRVSGTMPLPAYVYVETGCCTECGARISMSRTLPWRQTMNFKTEEAFVGARGIDSVTLIDTPDKAAKLTKAKVDFVVQYLGSVSGVVLENICGAGLAVMLVTYANRYDGAATVDELRALNAPKGMTVWLDVESVGDLDPTTLRAKINAWAAAVSAAGYMPGMYVGPNCKLTSIELYQLQVVRYWHCGAKIIDRNGQIAEPGCGFCMYQLFPEITVGGQGGVFVDFDVIQQDFRGRLPVWLRAE